MLAGAPVTGPGAPPLDRAIAGRPSPHGAPPSWSSTKYLLDRGGRLAARYGSSVEPDDLGLGAALSRLFAEPVAAT